MIMGDEIYWPLRDNTFNMIIDGGVCYTMDGSVTFLFAMMVKLLDINLFEISGYGTNRVLRDEL